MRTIGRTIQSRDSGLISREAYNRDFTVYALRMQTCTYYSVGDLFRFFCIESIIQDDICTIENLLHFLKPS